GIDRQEQFLPSRRRGSASADARGNQTEGRAQTGWINRESDGNGARTTDHAGAVERIDAEADQGSFLGKLIHRHVVHVRPPSELWGIPQSIRVRWIIFQCVKVPAAGYRIAGLGHTDAFPEGVAGKSGMSKISYHPAISELIIKHKRISVVLVPCTARSAA